MACHIAGSVLLAAACVLAEVGEPPPIPVGMDAYRLWEQWPQQRLGVRAYMRSTYDRSGGNETADASHFLYQEAEEFNVSLDVEGQGVLYFVRTNHWHGSPWHYEVDGVDHIVSESTTADPTRPLEFSTFLPERLFPEPLAWTYTATKGADLMWVPIPFAERLRLAYSRTFYGTGYYIYHLLAAGTALTRPSPAWDAETPPPQDVLDLLRSSGTDIAPREGLRSASGTARLGRGQPRTLLEVEGPSTLRALKLSVPAELAREFGRARLRITWDGREHPSVDAPVALFFGAGSLYRGGEAGYLVKALPVNIRFSQGRVRLACYFPMPFFRSARIALVGADGAAIPDIQWSARWEPYEGPPNHVGYFHATYRDHPDPVPGEDNVFLDTAEVEGGGDWSGSFVGTSFTFSDRAVLTTLEGDPRFFFDDSNTPQGQGTGTEEWGGGGDYWGGRNMTLPLAGHPCGVRSPELATHPDELIQSAYRFLLADLMPFGKRAVIRLEHGGTNESTEHYRSVTYWYGLPAPSLVLTDEIDIGDAESEAAHSYHSPEASGPYEITSRYEWGVDHIEMGTTEHPVAAEPVDYAEVEFEARGGVPYTIWLRGRSSGGNLTDATWFQFDEDIGTEALGPSCDSAKGLGNWRDAHPAGEWAWCSSLPDAPPQRVTFAKDGLQRLRIQLRHGPHEIDQILLSPSREVAPDPAVVAFPQSGDILIEAEDAVRVAGGFAAVEAEGASGGRALRAQAGKALNNAEVYPAHTEVGRITTGASEFELALRPDNHGVLLRRTLDYQYPQQRAEVFVTDPSAAEPRWRRAGVWYLAGSNTCYHSYPTDGELGRSNPVVQTSNRRFRDDEFLIGRDLTRGLERLRVRVEFTPTDIPLLPGRPLDPQAWSEIRYSAYCFIMPEFSMD